MVDDMNDGPISRTMTQERSADSEALRALAARTSALPFDAVEVKITPAQRLGSITASAADKHGNIYVYHRPKKDTLQDPIVVIDSKGSFLRSFGKGLDP